jgi:2-polyprenyl-6-methoxyphenol hydroxylase-like FAD-dependent oxidoreductase
MAANSILRVDIVGGGPVGLATAIFIMKYMSGLIRIRVFDTRWNATGSTVEWKGIEAGNNRRTQVVTIQSNV